MTLEELETLIDRMNTGDVDAALCVGDLYIGNYAKLRAKFALDMLYSSFIKTLWTGLKDKFPSIIAYDSAIKNEAVAFQKNPGMGSMQKLLKLILKTAQWKSAATYASCSGFIKLVFKTVASHTDAIAKRTMGEYSRDAKIISVFDNFKLSPSFDTFVVMVKKLSEFANNTVEIKKAQACLDIVFANYDDVVASNDKNDLERRCEALSNAAKYGDEYKFILEKRLADNGDVQAIATVAQMLEYGRGTEVDEQGAAVMYSKAISLGHDGAQALLENLRHKQHTRHVRKMDEWQRSRELEIKAEESKALVEVEKQRVRDVLEALEEQRKEMEAQTRELAEQKSIEKQKLHLEREKVRGAKVKVCFRWRYDGIYKSDSKIMQESAYTALLAGGERAIFSYIRSNFEIYSVSYEIEDVEMVLMRYVD